MRKHFGSVRGVKTIQLKTIIFLSLFMFCLTCSADKAISATPPLLPFNNTGDLFVLDHGSYNILRITPSGVITIEVTTAQIMAATGWAGVGFRDRGIAFDAAGSLYFAAYDYLDPTPESTGAILKCNTVGALAVLTTAAQILAATADTDDESMPNGIAFGSDGMLYVNEDASETVLQINPSTGGVSVYVSQATFEALGGITLVDFNSPIVGAEGGIIYTASDDDPDAIFAIAPTGTPSVLASGSPFNDLDVFMTRALNLDLIIADDSIDTIHRVTPAGVVSTFLSEAQLEAVTGADVDLEGGIAFDSSGNFYVAEENSDSILRFDSALNGSVWIPAAAMQAVTGMAPDLDGGIAFAIGVPPAAIPTINQWGMIIFSLLMAGAALWIMRRKQTTA